MLRWVQATSEFSTRKSLFKCIILNQRGESAIIAIIGLLLSVGLGLHICISLSQDVLFCIILAVSLFGHHHLLLPEGLGSILCVISEQL
jgi:uncharacterized membrane protein YiaA